MFWTGVLSSLFHDTPSDMLYSTCMADGLLVCWKIVRLPLCHYLCFSINRVSMCEQWSGCGPSLTVHRGHPLTVPGVWALYHGLVLYPQSCGAAARPLSLTIASFSTAPGILIQHRWASLGWRIPQGQGVEQTLGRIIPQSKQVEDLVLITVPARCMRARSGGTSEGGGGSRTVLWVTRKGGRRREGRNRRRWGRRRSR